MSQIRDEVRNFIATTFLNGTHVIEDDTSLERAHVVDSAGFLELILFLEESYGIEVDNEEATPDNFDSVNAITSYVERKKAA